MTYRLDRNGIPILDSPRESHFRERCHPALHQWIKDPLREETYDSDYDSIYGLTTTLTTTPLICKVCGATDVDERARSVEDFPGRRRR